MELIVKTFDELTASELYEIYKLRVDVFVVEQQCAYHEIDEFDKVSTHLWLEDNGEIVAYLRVLPPHTTFDEASIGRVIATRRRDGLATRLINDALRYAKYIYNAEVITIEAQCYARGLYEKIGFVQTSEEFLEDGIPHIQMQYKFEDIK